MKTGFVTELLSEQTITSFFLVHEKEVRNTREGRAYLRLELGDRSGTIEARMWEQFEIAAKDINRDDFVKVQARVEVYRNRPQLALVQVRLAKPEEIDLADYLPHTAADVEKMWAELLAFAESIRSPWLKKLVLEIVTDPGTARCYKRAPAAKVMHHAYLGGLLEHVIGLCGMAKLVAQHYPELDVDLLLTAALLHDVGKLEELCYERAIGYTTPGQLLGHIVMELETVTRAMDKIDGFPAALKTVVQHLLISHHGQYEFGSPKLPMIREAMVFHYLDDLDSKMAAVRVALASGAGDEEWSAYSAALGRKFLKLGAFLKTNEAATRQPEQLPLQPASEQKMIPASYKIRDLTIRPATILAPMAGVTDTLFRRVIRGLGGCGLLMTEFTSSEGITRSAKKTLRYLYFQEDEHPITAQLFGANPEVMADAARMVEDLGYDAVDINLGCPAKKVVKCGGSGLLRDLPLLGEIFRSVRAAVKIPLTIKLRAGWDENSVVAVDVAKMAEDSGVEGVAVHPRTRTQGYSGSADWNLIAAVKRAVRIPVIGNGDVNSPEDAERIVSVTGCDAVMIGRAAATNPWIFRQMAQYAASGRYDTPSDADRHRLLSGYYQEITAANLPDGVGKMKQFACWFTHGVGNGSELRRTVHEARTQQEVLDCVERFFEQHVGAGTGETPAHDSGNQHPVQLETSRGT